MSEVSIVYSGNAVTLIGELMPDACLDENHSFSSTITKFPVEDGSVIGDHIFNNPDKLTIHGIISNYPLPKSIGNKIPESSASVLLNSGTVYTANAGYDTAAQDALDYLLRIRKNKELVNVVTSLRRYENMAIEDIKIPREAKHGGALEFTITLEQVTIVSSSTVPATVLSPAQGVSSQAAPKIEKGKQSPELTKEQRKSLIIKFLNLLGVE